MSDVNAVLGLIRSISRAIVAESFEGRLVDQNEQPIINAHVYFNDVCSTQTAMSGRFTVNLKNGTYSISVEARGVKVDNIDRVVVNSKTDYIETITVDAKYFEAGKNKTDQKQKESSASDSASKSLSINEATVETNQDSETEVSSEDVGLLAVTINEEVITGDSVKELYKKTIEYLITQGLLDKNMVPWSTSNKRHLIALEPTHPTGQPFKNALEIHGFFIECNKSREMAPKHMQKFIDSL